MRARKKNKKSIKSTRSMLNNRKKTMLTTK